jgi:pimeloyl-ACP methyl ester carboxylesterase
MGVSGGGTLAIDFTLEHPDLVDALIPVTAGVSGYQPSEEEMSKHPEVAQMYASLGEAFERHDVARAVEISLALWTDGPGRLPAQAAPDVRERVRRMTQRNWERPDDEAQAETPPVPLEPPAMRRLSEIGVPTLVMLGAWDAPNPLSHLAAEIRGAKTVVMAETAHHPFMEKPAEFNQIVLEFLGSLQS